MKRFLWPTVIALLLVSCGARSLGDAPGTPPPPAPQVTFPSVSVRVELAQTEPQRELGLGGHAPLAETDGMLFIFDRALRYSFWMKGMTFPLDIMWLDHGQVVYVAANLPAPSPGQSDGQLAVYTPSAPAQYVLEVKAGFAERHGITVGTPVQFSGVPDA